MKKGMLALLIGICIILGGIAFFTIYREDRTAPEIQLQDVEITYTEGSDFAELLTGVTATDNRDGDVTANLIVEGVYPNDDGTTASVVYVARDAANNIKKISRIVNYRKAGEGDEPETELSEDDLEQDTTVQNTNDVATNGNGTLSASGNDVTAQNTVPNSEQPSEADQENDTDTDLPQGSPQIKLRQSRVTITKGQSINRISFVESITDDKDDKDTLWKQIQIVGDEFDNATSGTYEQIYYVVDSDGNKSNEAKLTIVVQ